MVIFIDESGLHKTTDHASVALMYVSVDDYPAFEQTVMALERQLKIPAFHWAETAWPVKQQFLDAVLKLDFHAKVAIFENSPRLMQSLETALLHLVVEPNIRTIYLDGKKSRRYERSLKKVLRDRGISVRKVRTVRDTEFAGIRVADMIAGLVRSIADCKNMNRLKPYYERLNKKLIVSIDLENPAEGGVR